MNIIRTKTVELSNIPAIAYKLKLSSGGAGIKLIRLDRDASAAATIDKRTGEAIPYGVLDETLFPAEAFDEAMELTAGLPYAARGNIRLDYSPSHMTGTAGTAPQTDEENTGKAGMLESDEYKAIVERYSDEKGKLNYQLLNKDFIQFASKSKIVADMVGDKLSNEAILMYIVKSRAALIAGKKESLDDVSVTALIETMDEIDPRSAFKELKAHINRMLSRTKRA